MRKLCFFYAIHGAPRPDVIATTPPLVMSSVVERSALPLGSAKKSHKRV